MASPGEKLREVWTADFANQLRALLARSQRVVGAGPVTVSNTKNGSQIVLPRGRQAVSTIQGQLAGGTAPSLSDGTEILDPYAFASYSIQAAYFILSAGTTTLTVNINGTPVSWLSALSISTVATIIQIPSPVPDLTHVIPVEGELTFVFSGSSSDAAGFSFSLNCPF